MKVSPNSADAPPLHDCEQRMTLRFFSLLMDLPLTTTRRYCAALRIKPKRVGQAFYLNDYEVGLLTDYAVSKRAANTRQPRAR